MTTESCLRQGLATAEAAARPAQNGPNSLPPIRRKPAVVLLLRQMAHFFALLLWGTSARADPCQGGRAPRRQARSHRRRRPGDGDAVVLEAGDRISADLELAHVHALGLNESRLTRESRLLRPAAGERAFSGMFVVEGQAEAVVAATGRRDRAGRARRVLRTGPAAGYGARTQPDTVHADTQGQLLFGAARAVPGCSGVR
ncbi:cation-transporting P-type ATPase [Nonomuraea sp. ATR24]|uniref:P-type ATPase n=1 Tax=Nonomuraea TaxID=83681 RepID=UPI001FE88656|nr:cation-transporting P-type ATPase [Nonomuraea ceibae]